jgi:hypothetical protein
VFRVVHRTTLIFAQVVFRVVHRTTVKPKSTNANCCHQAHACCHIHTQVHNFIQHTRLHDTFRLVHMRLHTNRHNSVASLAPAFVQASASAGRSESGAMYEWQLTGSPMHRHPTPVSYLQRSSNSGECWSVCSSLFFYYNIQSRSLESLCSTILFLQTCVGASW